MLHVNVFQCCCPNILVRVVILKYIGAYILILLRSEQKLNWIEIVKMVLKLLFYSGPTLIYFLLHAVLLHLILFSVLF
jgi:hypothetical protein